MSYINVGAYATGDMERIPTKTKLKAMIKTDVGSVTFDRTSAYEGGFLTATEIPPGDVLVVVGPDPYANRKWYANVSWNAKGIKVS